MCYVLCYFFSLIAGYVSFLDLPKVSSLCVGLVVKGLDDIVRTAEQIGVRLLIDIKLIDDVDVRAVGHL